MADVVTVWNPFLITNNGLNLRQQAIATGETITFTYAKIGQGVPTDSVNIPFMTDLVAPAQQVSAVRSELSGVTHYIGVRIDNITFPQPILMREIGLYASISGGAPILYGYTYATQGYDSIPAGSVSHYVWTVGIDTVISRAQSISFTYDGSTVYATHDDIDQLIQAFDAFKSQVEAIVYEVLDASKDKRSCTVSETQPDEQSNGDLWVDTSPGELFFGTGGGLVIANAVVGDIEPENKELFWLDTN